MPSELPDLLEAGTLNVPGIAGLQAGLRYVQNIGTEEILQRQLRQQRRCAAALADLGCRVFSGESQSGTVSFLPPGDCEEFAELLAAEGVAVRAGLHCAPLAHESAGTLETGTVRLSFGHEASDRQTDRFLEIITTGKTKKYFQ